MLKADIIEPSQSPWASPVVLCKKKDGSWRFALDLRKVNSVTIKDSYPLPRIDDSLDALRGKPGERWFSTLDLASGYWQIEMDPQDAPKTAFISYEGLYQFKVMPFGLTSAPGTFERLMESVLAGLNWKICLIYLDDVITFSDCFENHVLHLGLILQRLHQAGLKLQPKKCDLFKHQVKYLGYVVCGDGIMADPDKIAAIKSWKQPKCLKELRAFLVTFSDIAAPLNKLQQKDVTFIWNSDCDLAFSRLKDALSSQPILA